MHRVWLAAASSPQSGRAPASRTSAIDRQRFLIGSASGTP